MKTIFINLPHKLLILVIFGIMYVPILYFGIINKFNNILLGDGAKSLTFIWSIFLFTILNVVYLNLLYFRKESGTGNATVTKFIIRLNVEYGKIYTGLFFTTTIFVIQAIVVKYKIIISTWKENMLIVIGAFASTLLAFIIFPMVAAVINYFIVKYFRRALWKQRK